MSIMFPDSLSSQDRPHLEKEGAELVTGHKYFIEKYRTELESWLTPEAIIARPGITIDQQISSVVTLINSAHEWLNAYGFRFNQDGIAVEFPIYSNDIDKAITELKGPTLSDDVRKVIAHLDSISSELDKLPTPYVLRAS